jgi:hypothetical protein
MMFDNFYPYCTPITFMPCHDGRMLINQLAAFAPKQPMYIRKERRMPAW